MNNNQNILEKLKNLIEPESSILSELHNKKNKNEEIVAKAKASITSKNERITSIKNDIDTLADEKKLLTDAFASLKDTDLSLITSVLKLKINIKDDLDKLTNQLPLQITIRENDISDLENGIAKENENLSNANTAIAKLCKELEDALKNQAELKSLLAAATSSQVEKTRDEVISILKKVNFDDKEAYKTAKLILFPEDELVPFFKDYEFTSQKINEETSDFDTSSSDIVNFDEPANSDDFVDLDSIVSLLNKEPEDNTISPDLEKTEDKVNNNQEEETSTHKEEEKSSEEDDQDLISFEERLENETPISFEELRSLFENDKEDVPAKDIDTSATLEDQEPATTKKTKILEDQVAPIEDFVNFREETLMALGKAKPDIDLIKPFDTSTFDSKNILNTLKNEDIDSNDISLVIYQNGLDNYLANLKTLTDNGYKPSPMELQKFGVSLSLIDKAKLQENLHILSNYKVSLKNSNGKIVFKVLCQEPETLRRNLDLIIEARETNLLNYNVNALSQNIPLILERINFCKEYNIPYTEGKNNILTYNSYIFSQKVLEELVEKEIELTKLNKSLTNELESNISKEALEILEQNTLENPKLESAKKFDDYSKIVNKIEALSVSKENAYIIDNLAFSTENTKRNLITLVNHLDKINPKDIILAGLFYNSHKTMEDFARVEKEL